ncbi:MAG: hypothetical protein GF349_01335 [Candidatus Magasanikbacteria bacterium]|nr:hypothetical protein [Candidatus Magasanikbacteria bacterium]
MNNILSEASKKAFITSTLEKYPNILDDFKRKLNEDNMGDYADFDMDNFSETQVGSMYDKLKDLLEEKGIEVADKGIS